MPIRILLKKTGIRNRIIIAAILPVLMMSILLGNYYIQNWDEDASKRINENGSRYSVDLSKLSEFALFTNNKVFLDVVSRSLFSDPDVYSVRIMDKDKKDIISRIAPNYLNQPHDHVGKIASDDMVFIAMVYPGQLTTIEGDEFYEAKSNISTDQTDLLGWIEITMTDAHQLELKNKMVGKMVLIILTVLAASFTLAFSISSRITRPIFNMKELVTRVASDGIGPYYHASRYPDELGELENTFYEMATAVHNSKYELQKRVDVATARNQETISRLEKSNAELIKARELMFQANEAKSDFMAKMSHEIRTPLHSIIGYINLIKKTHTDPNQTEYLRVVDGASHHLLMLINDILDISSIDSRGVELEHDNFNLRECLEDVVLLLAPGAHKKGIEFIFLFDSDVPVYVIGDQYCLKQVLINLLGNAIKFTDEGEVVLHVFSNRSDIDSTVVSMSITDTGIGINPDQVDLIQTPFYQVDSTRNRDYEGTGLGLAIVKKLLSVMSGELSINSSLGKGSTFHFSITFDKQANHSEMDDEYANSLWNFKILCFEPHSLAMRALRNQILKWTTQVFTASTIERVGELLDAAEQGGSPFDLLILAANQQIMLTPKIRSELQSFIENRQIALLVMDGEIERNNCDYLDLTPNCVCVNKPAGHDFLHNMIVSLLTGVKALTNQRVIELEDNNLPVEPENESQTIPKILLAEDNNFNRVYVATLLRENNISVTEAVNGNNALVLAADESFDLILMDIHLPEIDGISVAKRIKTDATRNKHTPVLALTADLYISDTPDYKEAGFSGHIVKPIDEAEFWHMVGGYLNRSGEALRSGDIFDKLDKVKQTLFPQLIKELPEHSQKIRQAYDEKDHYSLVEHLHQLKGVSGYFKLSTLQIIVAAAEGYVRDNHPLFDWDEVAPLLEKVHEQIRLIIECKTC